MRFFLLLAASAAAAPALAAAQQSNATRGAPIAAGEFSTGIEYREGDYGTGQKVETRSINNNLRVVAGQLQLSANLPYLRVDSPGNVVGGGGGLLGLPIIIDPRQPTGRVRREGVGDLRLGAAYSIPNVGLTLSSQVKLPTASTAKALGTGKVDVGVGAELARTIGKVTPFAGVGYTMPGDPEGYDLRNSLSAHAGLAAQLGQAVRGHVSYGYAQSLSPLVPDEQQISTGLNAGLGRGVALGLYGSAGLSKGAPDFGAGVQIGIKLF